MTFDRIAVVGAGAWGTALANVIARAGRTVTLARATGRSARRTRRAGARARGCRACGSTSASRVAPVEPRRSGATTPMLLAVPAQHLRAAAAHDRAGARAPARR